MNRTGAVVAFCAICACFLFIPISCGEDADSPPKSLPKYDVILISMDTTRADRLGVYGRVLDGYSTSPNLDALAALGVAFQRAQASAPLTLPSHTTMLTGLEPPQHGLRENNDFRLARPQERSFKTLAEAYSAAGGKTAAFVSARVLASDFGLASGFDVYDEVSATEGGQLHFEERDALATTDAALRYLDDLEEGPLFLWLHYFDPHHPHEKHRGRAGEVAKRFGNDYDGEISFMDAQIGRLLLGLKEKGRFDDSLIICVGDHGEGLGDHGEETHGFLLHQATTQVPFILKAPKGMALPKKELPAATADVAITAAALVGLGDLSQSTSGRNLFDFGDEARQLYAETVYPYRQFGWAALQSLIAGDLKLVSGGGREELYDLKTDPSELKDLAEDRPEDRARMLRLLRAQRQSMGRRDQFLKSDQRVADLNSLRSNAYAGGPSYDIPEEPRPDEVLAHPADKLEVVAALDELTRQIDKLTGLDGDARQREVFVQIETLIRLLEARDPKSPAILFWIGRARLMLGKSAAADDLGPEIKSRLLNQAREDLLRYSELRSRDPRALNMRHSALLVLARIASDPAATLSTLIADFEVQERRGLADGLAYALCARALEALGRKKEALQKVEKAVELEPERRAFLIHRDQLRNELKD